MSLRSIQAEGHRIIDAHYQALTESIREMIAASSMDPAVPLERMVLERRIERMVATAEPRLTLALAALFEKAERDGEQNG